MLTAVKCLFGWCLVLACGLNLWAAERNFDFGGVPAGKLPADWAPLLAGKGKPGEWQVLMDEVAPQFKPLSSQAPSQARREVLAQVSRDPTDERFPLLVYQGERFGDFTARFRFKLVAGVIEQMAGLVFRLQDEKNFYVVRASASGNVRFYKFVNGERNSPIGPEIPVSQGEWHELSVKCTGNQIDIQFDGKPAMPTLTDNSHLSGQLGFFTKSDAVSYFSDLRLDYRPLESLAQVLVRQTLKDQPRLLDVRICGRRPGNPELTVLAAKTAAEIGQAPVEGERKAFAENRAYYSKESQVAVVTHPLHDRNGEPIGVARFTLKAYKGQLEAATLGRVLPIVKRMQDRIGAASELTE
jgi:hypothetical protein